MDKPRKKAKSEKPKRGPVVFVSLDSATEAALRAFIGAQRIPPDRAAVGLTAIREFLTREGYPPRPPA